MPYLEDLRKKLKELQNSGTLDIQDMKVVSDKIHEIDDAVIKQKDNWGLTNEALVQHKRLLEEAAEAQERLNIAQGTLSMAKFEQSQKQNEIQAMKTKRILLLRTKTASLIMPKLICRHKSLRSLKSSLMSWLFQK